MNDNYKIWKAFDADQIQTIKKLIEVGNWRSGNNSFIREVKQTMATNKEYDQAMPNYPKVRTIVYDAMDSSQDFLNFCLPKTSTEILISKYDPGEYMSIHEDHVSNGDFSTTIFLNDPTTYEGGELCLFLNGKEEKIKLEAGYAITYNTGILHRVNRLESGQRLVIALWSKSFCTDPLHRGILNDLHSLSKFLPNDNETHSDFESYTNSPQKIVKSIKNRILRLYDIPE